MTDALLSSYAQPGVMIAQKYRIERVLGRGGMGVVVAATHVQIQQLVALKFLLPSASRDGEAVERFTREAQATARIRSEHAVRVLDVGTLDDGAPFLVMEYVEGRDLERVLEESGPLPIPKAVDYVLQACVALAEAHTAGIVHRDLKPSNLFLARQSDGSEIIKVLDFGISKFVPDYMPAEMRLTQASATMGSPLYMSPEQMRSAKDVDPRSDVWALGTVLHELVTGQPAFMASSVPELCAQVLSSIPAPALPLAALGLSVRFEAALRRALEKKAHLRYANVAELAQALAEFAPEHARVHVERVLRIFRTSGTFIADRAPVPREASSAAITLSASPAQARRRFGRGGLLAAGLVVIVATAAVLTLARRRALDHATRASAAGLVHDSELRIEATIARAPLAPPAAGPTPPSASPAGPLSPPQAAPTTPATRNATKRLHEQKPKTEARSAKPSVVPATTSASPRDSAALDYGGRK